MKESKTKQCPKCKANYPADPGYTHKCDPLMEIIFGKGNPKKYASSTTVTKQTNQFNIKPHPESNNHTLEVKGVPYTLSLTELAYLRDLITVYLQSLVANHD